MKKNILFALVLLLAIKAHAQNHNLIIGTYTNKGNSEGIYVYDYNSTTAETKLKYVAKGVVNPSYLALSKNRQFLYSVNENGGNSAVSAFSFNAKDGSLNFLNQKPALGADPCFVMVDGKNIIIANYSGGSISAYFNEDKGALTDSKQLIKHTGKSIDPKRQASAHVHQVQLSPDKKYVIATDLGEDQVYVYHYNANSQNTPLTLKHTIKTNAGSGPRHLAFSPNGKFAYLAHEFNGSITVYAYANGDFTKLQEIATTAKDFTGKIDGADIHVSADGKFLYETNRGDANTISTFTILPNGTLQPVETVSTLGKGPRNFSIDPSGNFLLVAHQYTNDVVIFHRDKKTGRLKDSGKRINVGIPVCLLFTR